MKANGNLKSRNRILEEILKVLKSSRTFFLSGHQNPDPDVIGSELALRSFILKLGKSKKVDIYNAHAIPPNLRFLPGSRFVKSAKYMSKNYDCAVIMECANPERMGNIIDLKTQSKTVINIDHHLHNSKYGQINLIDPSASSNAEEVLYLLELAGMGVTAEEATCLFAGLVTDTGRFQYSNTVPESHRVASRLLEYGAKSTLVCQKIYMEKPLAALKLLGDSLREMKILEDGKIALIVLDHGAFERNGAQSEDTEDIVNYGLFVPTVKASALLRPSEKPGEVKVSLRAKGSVDVNKVARAFGGGGHKKASGCTLRGSLEEAAQQLLPRLKAAVG